ncbi:Berberine and berberine like [Tenacibaculum sp. MAR_2009_124]|uniref:FAD-dependent oxidoreductase n=1 Tax=Tenacibaculum sp. MAR_2009_124 TaxID=1250059 RepID=UPI00089BF35F|nr:FAD-dependent oxidoreductase [Tenacibaculum sp. MAR_2009_124]SEB36546.1 Berberine and berberine like [Tenacibaculum sp. MAR_2009_124]
MNTNIQKEVNKLLKENINNFLKEIQKTLPATVTVSTNWGSLDNVYEHFKNSRIFNRRLQFNPFIIVYCESPEDVQNTFKAAKNNNLPFKVRAGGHDHEGECTGTNVILIDVSKMNYPEHNNEKIFIENIDGEKIAHIRPGIRFKDLTSRLADQDVMIAHGTCATVGIAGFTMGGGWGPWTRKYGMCCERLVGATILLGNGEFVELNEKNGEVPDLLWALRGGGGMSYGIVTEFRIKTFELPKVLHRFNIVWNPYSDINPDEIEGDIPALEVLKKWEEIILPINSPQLIGTNLKMSARSWDENTPVPYKTINLNCQFNGYWEGNEGSLREYVKSNFKGVLAVTDEMLTIEPATGADFEHKSNYGENLMSSWDRESFNEIKTALLPSDLLMGTPLQPDLDLPAPHKITSRLVDKIGLGNNGHQKLIESLCSTLLNEHNRKNTITTYITLGAITGDFYKNHPKTDSAFPYNDKQYTIQYQCWWEALDGDMDPVIKNYIEEKIKNFQNNTLYDYTNRALDWIEVCRDFDIPNTSGAFISFKDSSIPTKTYFADSYDKLIKIKENYSEDPFNHFRSRKTII